MTEKYSYQYLMEKIRNYFTLRDIEIILGLGVIAYLTNRYGLSQIIPGGTQPNFVHAFLNFPGPCTGAVVGSAFVCLWLVLGILLVRKPGGALGVSIVTYILLLLGSSILGTGIIKGVSGFLIMAAIIIEIFGLLAIEKKPWSYIFPVFIGIMGLITLALMVTGNAVMKVSTAFPLGYAVTGILALFICVLCYMYPMKYVFGAGVAEMVYIVSLWLFKGDFGSYLPVTLAIPGLLSFALVSASSMALIAYGINALWNTYNKVPPLPETEIN